MSPSGRERHELKKRSTFQAQNGIAFGLNMHRNSVMTMLLALIQVLVSGALLGYFLIVHGVLALFSGTGDYELSRGVRLRVGVGVRVGVSPGLGSVRVF
jgi:hypothetical protein